jgi:pimeloyl-ACP methyl ester carboxylesterase
MTALIVLPGLDGTATLHSSFCNAVNSSFEAVTVIPYPPQQVLDYSALVALVRKELPLTTPFVLLGESFSGPVALSIGADPPPNLIAVVLSTSFGNSPMPVLSRLAAFIRFAPVRTLPRSMLSWWLLGRWATPELEASVSGALLAVSPAVLKFRAAAALKASVPNMMAIAVPVLYLRATQDRLLPPSVGAQVLSSVPSCTLIDIEGPHLLLQTAPQSCARAIGDFVENLPLGENTSF